MRSQRGRRVEYPGQNSNFIERKCWRTCTARSSSIAGRASCIGLLALAVMLINPIVGSSASALEGEGMEKVADGVMADGEGTNMAEDTTNAVKVANGSDTDYGIMPTATTSTVAITFNPTSASGAMTPIDGSGAKAKVDVKATVRVQNSGGYAVYVGSNSSQLNNGSNVIDPVVSTTTYANLPVNKWGYSFIKRRSIFK